MPCVSAAHSLVLLASLVYSRAGSGRGRARSLARAHHRGSSGRSESRAVSSQPRTCASQRDGDAHIARSSAAREAGGSTAGAV
jgi:hypothetical protein